MAAYVPSYAGASFGIAPCKKRKRASCCARSVWYHTHGCPDFSSSGVSSDKETEADEAADIASALLLQKKRRRKEEACAVGEVLQRIAEDRRSEERMQDALVKRLVEEKTAAT